MCPRLQTSEGHEPYLKNSLTEDDEERKRRRAGSLHRDPVQENSIKFTIRAGE
jgi:hypothetical protein